MRDFSTFIAADMRPFSMVENVAFQRLLHTLEPKYSIPSRMHLVCTVDPDLNTLKKAESITITTNKWTFRGTQSYITVTAHIINRNWEMVNVVLQTRPLCESHTGANIAEVLQAAVSDWDLIRPNHARNMEVAAREARI